VFEEDMGRVLALSAITPEAGLASIERDVLGVDHHQVGGWLADRWHLPPEVVVVMEHHHEPDYRGPHWAHALLVGSCARLADGALERDEIHPELPEEFSVLGIGEEGLGTLGRVFGQRLPAIREIASTLADIR
jgi:HD-like signal output (HDOD) protein